MKRVVFGNRNVFISVGYIPRSRNCRKSGDCLTTTLFSKVALLFYISINSIEGFNFSTPSSILVIVFLILVILADMKCYFLILIWVALCLVSDVKYFLCACPFINIYLENYLDPLPIFLSEL